jgi:hypothetical protein
LVSAYHEYITNLVDQSNQRATQDIIRCSKVRQKTAVKPKNGTREKILVQRKGFPVSFYMFVGIYPAKIFGKMRLISGMNDTSSSAITIQR